MSLVQGVDVDIDEVEAALTYVRERLDVPYLRAWQKLQTQPFLEDRIEARFRNEGDEVTAPWAPLRLATAAIRRATGFGAFHPINRRTGALFNWVKTFSLNGSTLTMPGAGGSAELRSKLAIAQVGGYPPRAGRRSAGPNRPAPPRPVLAVGARDEQYVVSSLIDWVMK